VADIHLPGRFKNRAMKYEEYQEAELKPFAEKLQSEYYDSIEILCANTRKQSDKIRGIDSMGSALQYVTQCEKIVADVEKHVKDKKAIYIPYVHSLVEKVADNHNCSKCTGSCKVNHEMHIWELNATNEEMKKVLNRLQFITLPLYSETLYPDEYRLLRSNMTLLETSLTELFFLENNYLIPKITGAQKSINAGNK